MLRSLRLRLPPLWLAVCWALVACKDEPPGVAITGGGFIFNYRLAEAHYGIVAKVSGAVPAGAVLEATFDDPGGGSPVVLRHAVEAARRAYKLETPPLVGIRAEHPYRVTLRLVGPEGGTLAEAAREFSSRLAQEVLPERPLTAGPGYHAPPPAEPR